MPEVEFSQEKNRLSELINYVCKNHSAELVATDTHRWVEPDGFYEVQFMIKFPQSTDYDYYESGIFIHNISGNQNLEDQWSKNNPQKVYFDAFSDDLTEFDLTYAIEKIEEWAKENHVQLPCTC